MKFGIKFKIILGISLLLIVCTAFNLGYSYKLFTEDKTSYIFEAGLKKAENISDQINFKLNDLIVRAEFNSALLGNPEIDFDKLINNQNEIVMVGILETKNGQASIVKEYLNTKSTNRLSAAYGINPNDFIKEVLSSANTFSLLSGGETLILSPKSNLKFLLHITKMVKSENLLFSISDLSPLLEIFYKDQIYINKIISLTSARERRENAEWISGINYQKSKKGAFETKINNQDVLLAYVFVNDKILVLNAINKSEAFGITKYLILKTSIFAFFLLGLATIAGIYFSSSITFPIIKLTNNAKKIAKGDFSSKVHIKTSDEIKILGDTFNLMSSEIRILLKNKEQLIAKLEDYSKNLEKMVEKRTLELKEANDFMALMVNSLDQGLLVFDNELKCHPMFTKACEQIFGISPLDKSIPEILSISNVEALESLKQWSQVVFNEMIPFESAIGLGPRQKITGRSYDDLDYKFVQIDYYPMRDDDDKISNVVMIGTDRTNEVQATEKAKEKEAYVSMILKILNNKPQFESFVSEVEDIFGQFKKAFSIEEKKIEFDLCMMLFHTLNGGFGIYNITKLQLIARDCENKISNIKDTNPDILEYIPVLESYVENLKQEFLNFKVELDSLVGTKFATNQHFTEVSRDMILELKKLVLQTNNEELKHYYSEYFVKVPIINYFKAYDDLCKTTAIKINKEFNGLTFHNSELRIEVEPLLEFFNVLVHLFRNCLDHGIEDASIRQLNGKDPVGHIDISFDTVNSPEGKLLLVVIQDDGAGIDPQVIRTRWQKMNADKDISNLLDKEVIYKIFDPFFTTRDEVSDLSGRGVGMSAIKEVVDHLNGYIEIESHIGIGTIFSFLIPVNELL
ncbi:MAG: ATP-binding protein [Bacteriovorax sp.]|nr:ATP-binding protein [Bacteriovorax sp.]